MIELRLNDDEGRAVRHALMDLPKVCRFHGDDLERSGMRNGLPHCESCRIPWRSRQAWKAFTAALDRRDDEQQCLVPAPSVQAYEWGFRLADGDAVVPALSEEAARAATGPDPESTRLWPEGPPKVVAVRRPVGPWVSVGEAKTDG